MLGLDLGGACRGIAFRVAAADRAGTIAYLRAREQVTMVYREAVRRVWLKSDAGAAGAGALLRGRPQPPAICRPADASTSNSTTSARDTASRAPTVTTSLPP